MEREKRKPPRAQLPDGRRWAQHELYGKVPQIRHSHVGPNGKSYEWWQWDPLFIPKLPPRAIAGDVSKQNYCTYHHAPKYFFVDETRECVQCGERFVFGAAEQKHWYEVLKFNFASVPIRCVRCRRQRRSDRALHNQVAAARRSVETAPDDPSAQIALARALVENHERTERGNLDDAIAAARRARKLWPESPEPDLWEGVAQARAGHLMPAGMLLERFVERSQGRLPSLESKARSYLAR